MRITWKGPYSWPGFESVCNLKKLPKTYGVYILTFKYRNGYMIYCPGETGQPFINRFKQHQYKYMNGEYHVLDIDSAVDGKRKLIWRGWSYHDNERIKFEANKKNILAVIKQLAGFRIFITKIGNKRIRNRLEAAIIEYLENQPLSIIDKGMFRSSRKDSEKIITVVNNCNYKIYGLPKNLEI